MKLFLLILADVLLGYVPQAAGCAICLFTITRQKLNSREFWFTAGIFSAISIIIRTAYNIGIIDFGFHTIIIWSIFILVAIFYNRFPAMQSICSILLSGILIAFSEIITAVTLIIIYGNENFTAMMNNTQDIDGQIVKAVCGIPANILFVIIVLIIYVIKSILRKRKAKASENASVNP
jgi:hypothetical protein